MDLNFTAEETAFRHDIRQWVARSLPADISHKVHNALRLSRDDMQRWARRAGWAGVGPSSSADRAGMPSKSTCSKRNVPSPARRASCPLAR